MKKVILILGILTTIMVCSVVAGVSTNAGPDIDMDLTETQCRVCHSDTYDLRNLNHDDIHSGSPDCYTTNCHIKDKQEQQPKELNCMVQYCHDNPADYPNEPPATEESLSYTIGVTDHHDFTVIFDNDDWDCLSCHEQGVPRPINK